MKTSQNKKVAIKPKVPTHLATNPNLNSNFSPTKDRSNYDKFRKHRAR